jgi:hypothetical protein
MYATASLAHRRFVAAHEKFLLLLTIAADEFVEGHGGGVKGEW